MRDPIARFSKIWGKDKLAVAMYCYCHKESGVVDAKMLPSQAVLMRWCLFGHRFGAWQSQCSRALGGMAKHISCNFRRLVQLDVSHAFNNHFHIDARTSE